MKTVDPVTSENLLADKNSLDKVAGWVGLDWMLMKRRDVPTWDLKNSERVLLNI